jgi:cyclase
LTLQSPYDSLAGNKKKEEKMIQKITSNVYAETGVRGCNHTFVITKEGIVLIDTPQMPADALNWRSEIAKHGEVRYIINSEPHGDHFSGNFFFGGIVVGHEGTRKAILNSSPKQFKERLKTMAPDQVSLMDGFKFRAPTITLNDTLTIFLGDHTFQVIAMPGHSPSQVAVFIPEERVVCTSDNVSYKVAPWLPEALPFEWLKSLKRLESLEADVMVPGHGAVCKKNYTKEMADFIRLWIDTVQSAIDKGWRLEEAQGKINLLDRMPMEKSNEAMGPMVMKMNVARLYDVLKIALHS